jgi:hypothetical protein
MRCVWGVLPNFAVWDPGVRRLGPALRIGPNVVLPSGVSILSKSSRSPCTFTGRRPETEIAETLSLGSVISMAASSQAASIRIAALTQAAVGIRNPNMGLVRSLGHEADSAGQSRCGPGSRLEARRAQLQLGGGVKGTESVITVTHAQETNLAWALIDAAKPHMNIGERNYAVVTVGAGDTFPAIC